MGRYLGPSCRLCRREGVKLFLKGLKCSTPKCPLERRGYAPGQHGQSTARRQRLSSYGLQLREKQKVKRLYGMFERQFKFYFGKAQKSRGVTGAKLLEFLERRLDNVVYRLGFATSRKEGREMVQHGAFLVNQRPVTSPNFLVRPGDTVTVRKQESARQQVRAHLEMTKDREVPSWVSLDADALEGRIQRLPERGDVTQTIQEQLIVELYSK